MTHLIFFLLCPSWRFFFTRLTLEADGEGARGGGIRETFCTLHFLYKARITKCLSIRRTVLQPLFSWRIPTSWYHAMKGIVSYTLCFFHATIRSVAWCEHAVGWSKVWVDTLQRAVVLALLIMSTARQYVYSHPDTETGPLTPLITLQELAPSDARHSISMALSRTMCTHTQTMKLVLWRHCPHFMTIHQVMPVSQFHCPEL